MSVIIEVRAIEKAATLLEAAKQTERFATEARIRAELALLELVPCKPEGSTTTRTPGWKVTTTGVVNRSVDQAVIEVVRGEMAPGLFDQAVRYKPELITAGVRYLQANEPDAYATLAQAFTAKPGKTGVVIERVNNETQEAA